MRPSNPTTRHLDMLCSCSDHREFLNVILSFMYGKGKPNLADFSRRAGFASRSYMSEMLSGKKGVSQESIRKIKKVLKIPQPYKHLFELLAISSLDSVKKDASGYQTTLSDIENLKKKLKSENIVLKKVNVKKTIFSRQIMIIYACLGSGHEGASLKSIYYKSNLSPQTVDRCLNLMLQEGLVKLVENKYFPATDQLDILDPNDSINISNLISEVARKIYTQSRSIVSNPENLAFYAAISISPAKSKEFKQKIEEAIFTVLDEYQDESPSSIVSEIFVVAQSR